MIVIKESDEFRKEFKKYSKKFRSLHGDYGVLIDLLKQIPQGNGSKHWNCLSEKEQKSVYKVRMACKSHKDGSPFRVIYSYNKKTIEILMIELYCKSDKESEDKERIREYMKNIT